MNDFATVCPVCGTPAPNAMNGGMPTARKQGGVNGLSIAALIVGIFGVIFAWIVALLGYILGGLSLVFAIIGMKQSKNGVATAGLILAIITLASSLINSIIGVLLVMAFL